jgi:uncharacterized protein (TIGR03086 family)
MAQQATPSPVDLYEAAVNLTLKVMEGIQPQQRWDPTPCTDWNVQAVMDHLLGGTASAIANLSGQERKAPRGEADAEEFAIATAQVLELAKTPGVMEKTITTSRGETMGGQLLMGSFMDVLIHGWDLAKGTGQDTTLPADLVDVLYGIWEARLDKSRAGGAFGSHVEVHDDASQQDKLLGVFGRKA